jgi:hypothetical protein
MFSKVIQSSECADHAVKIDGKIYRLIHNRGTFHFGIRGKIIDCQNGKSLYQFDSDDESDSESFQLPPKIAERLTDGIKEKLICDKPK